MWSVLLSVVLGWARKKNGRSSGWVAGRGLYCPESVKGRPIVASFIVLASMLEQIEWALWNWSYRSDSLSYWGRRPLLRSSWKWTFSPIKNSHVVKGRNIFSGGFKGSLASHQWDSISRCHGPHVKSKESKTNPNKTTLPNKQHSLRPYYTALFSKIYMHYGNVSFNYSYNLLWYMLLVIIFHRGEKIRDRK